MPLLCALCVAAGVHERHRGAQGLHLHVHRGVDREGGVLQMRTYVAQ